MDSEISNHSLIDITQTDLTFLVDPPSPEMKEKHRLIRSSSCVCVCACVGCYLLNQLTVFTVSGMNILSLGESATF